jgi:LPXTG-motif cell wall-anchored protein
MKKLIAILFTAALAVFGASPAFAQTGDDTEIGTDGGECAESDTRPTNLICEPDSETGLYPALDPEGGTVPDPTTTVVAPPSELPATGSSGSVGLLQIGGLMLAGGLLVVVASRRRTPAPTA